MKIFFRHRLLSCGNRSTHESESLSIQFGMSTAKELRRVVNNLLVVNQITHREIADCLSCFDGSIAFDDNLSSSESHVASLLYKGDLVNATK